MIAFLDRLSEFYLHLNSRSSCKMSTFIGT